MTGNQARCRPSTLVSAALLLTVILFNCLNATAGTRVEGRVFSDNGPFAGAIVSVYRQYSEIRADKPFMVSGPTDRDGLFSLELPAGQYYFTARGALQGKDYFSFHANNPINVQATNIWMPFMVSQVGAPVYRQGEPGIRGRVTFKGRPLTDGYITAYLPTDRTFKGLGFKTESLNSDGSFYLALTPGEYVLVAKKISDNSGLRPPQRGDLVGHFPGNPVEVRSGQEVEVEVPCYPRGDRSAFSDVPAIKANDFTILDELAQAAGAGIRGRVIDINGRPLKGVYVLAYLTSEEVFQMFHLSHGTPYSAVTDSRGDYFIPLDSTGDYYVVARDTLGDGPHRGEFYGLYQDHPMHRVSYAQGDLITDINITAGKTMDLTALQAESQQKAMLPLRRENPRILTDLNISRDTVWAGEVLVKGVVSVKRGATLSIEPGAIIRFVKIDRDQNGIGDGEIMVEGRLLARGTADRKIVFTSAEEQPGRGDWSYVNIIATEGEPNQFEYCVFEYGYSGMQVHYANTWISDCLFHKNGEGLHFNTANIIAEHSSFLDNGVGIKFSRLEGMAVLSNNLVSGNEIGIQFVHQHINALDFDNLHKVIEPPLFTLNNIFGNRKYNYTMGDRQSIDIAVMDNWWGSDDSGKIADSIFDKLDDDELGRVFYQPFLSAPLPDAGVREQLSK